MKIATYSHDYDGERFQLPIHRDDDHRLNRRGNRQLNAAFHRIAVTQIRYYGPARDYVERKMREGKSEREAIRCLKRQLVRIVFTTLRSDRVTSTETRRCCNRRRLDI